MFSIKDWIQSAIKEFYTLKKIVLCIKCHLALVTCIHVAVALCSHEWGVTIMVSETKFFSPNSVTLLLFICLTLFK